MKQASYSLLTLCQIPFKAKSRITAFFRDRARVAIRLYTPFYIFQESFAKIRFSVLLVSCPPRSFVCSWLGEGRIRSLLFIFCLIAFAVPIQSVFGVDNIVINLKEQAFVQSDSIVLKDIADLQGTDSAQIEKLAQTALGAAPHPGLVSALSRYQILARVQEAQSPTPEIRFSGAEVVQIRVQSRPVESEEISQIIIGYLARTASWKESEIEIQSIERTQGIELTPNMHLRISSRLPITGRGKIIFPIEIVQGSQTVRNFWVSARIRINAGILTATKPIRPGRVINPEDIVLSAANIDDLRHTYFSKADEVVGKISERNFSPGDPLTREELSDPLLIKRGDAIQLRLERSGLVITAQGRAEQDGRLGQIIRVRNLEFSTLLSAQVTGQAEAKVQ
jgi:flagellar basal body P-ring formation protein FlgA